MKLNQNLTHETQVRYVIINVFSYRTKLFTVVSNLPIHILCTSGRNVQDELELNSLSKNGYDNVLENIYKPLNAIISASSDWILMIYISLDSSHRDKSNGSKIILIGAIFVEI